MFYDEDETGFALNELDSLVREGKRPLVLWMGAGASTWAGYPLWLDVASTMHSSFVREERSYDRSQAAQLIENDQYPALFEQMRLANASKYYSILAERFAPRACSPIYERLIRAISSYSPLRIVTTNVDEALEHSLQVETVQRSDIERLPGLIASGRSFVCKLHGTVSSVESMVFSTRDYDKIRNDSRYLGTIRQLFADTTVLFLGYSLRDGYVLKVIEEAQEGRPLFGSGPHFIVTPSEPEDLPDSVRRIRYIVDESQPDHRAALAVIEAIREWRERGALSTGRQDDIQDIPPLKRSAYFIGDILAGGKWHTSQTLEIASDDGKSRQMLVGQGYVDGEIVVDGNQTLHDIIVGLICFDVVCVPIDQIGRLHEIVGSEIFWALIQSESIQVVVPPSEAVVFFPSAQALVGDVGVINIGSLDSTEQDFKPISVEERIRRQVIAAKGKEQEAERQLKYLEESVMDLSKIDLHPNLAAMTRGALMHPTIRAMLGVSQGTPRASIPCWVAFPILRLAEVIRRGIVCQHLNVSATRMNFGSERLATIAFSSASGDEWADSAASYALTGRFDSNLGAIFHQSPEIIRSILTFRESPGGEAFRKEVTERLASNEGGQVFASINAGLQQALPSGVLQKAHDQFSGLFVPRATVGRNPAILGDLRNAEDRIKGWRKQSRSRLQMAVAERNLGSYDRCPCGSGEKLKFCCWAALT